MEDKFYSIDQIAEILDMHHKTIRKFITEGKLRANKVGKQWRITGHDLSLFMESNNLNVSKENEHKEQAIEFSTNGENIRKSSGRINVSTVVDINEINSDQYMRISNTLIALLNSKDPSMGNSTINVKYYEKENKLKVLLWGEVKFTEDMLSFITMLVDGGK
ncbi:helix-turn-helix domain-containing protein [Clostridium sp. 'White wine YQ']|uniref:helix-turn-helix domain-containing protein n=1 Tax=Clostridium sp. 'White wine YQ' TaxID=3027474 RepID=UPI002365419A|nr:helix-turn-helix domain-containing protein [Clostridium sp. 'White wine YQ']MDD7793493.1 helix-turn-helix domain-containing protein [Clostridium sp. 'White wine YQ']